MALISPQPKLQFFTADGTPLAGGKLYTYAAGTTTPLATYTDQSGGAANPNPVILDSRGEASVWLGASTYKFALKTSTDVDVWTIDNISGGLSTVSPTFSGTATFTGNVAVQGSTTLGDAASDTLTVNGTAVNIPNNLNIDSDTLYIDASNNRVGIGTNAPAYKLDVNDDTVRAATLIRTTSGALTVNANNAAGTIDLRTANVSRATISAAGVFSYGGQEVGYRNIVHTGTAGGTAATTGRGHCYSTTGNVEVPANVFSAGDAFSIYNNSAAA
ncbi:MAG: hypothetical protein JSU95_04700, partial [Betaproteobacteria bacterium]